MKRAKVKLNGWINLHKPAGIGSTPALGIVKRALSPEKAGHGGTLDPLASGVLPIALGEATKTVAYAMDATKTYRFTIIWGEARDTEDAEGDIIATSANRPTDAQVIAVLERFKGNIWQTPPRYSAIKVDGQRAYDLARAGEQVEMKERLVRIDALDMLANNEVSADFEVTCGKGTYVRSLARDIALALNTYGYIGTLIRTRVGALHLEDAISLDIFRESGDIVAQQAALLPVNVVLDDIPALVITEDEATGLRRGQRVSFVSRHKLERLHAAQNAAKAQAGDVLLCIFADGTPVAFASVQGVDLKPERIFNL